MVDVLRTSNRCPLSRIALLAVGSFALGLDAYVMAGLLPAIADEFQVPIPATGQLVTSFTLCYALAAPVFATFLSGRKARWVLAAALVVFTLANAASTVAPSFAVLLTARAVAGSGAGLYSPLAAAAAAALSPPQRRGRSLAVVMGGMSSGTVLGVPAGLYLASHAGWRSTMAMVTILGLLALAGLLAWLPGIPAAVPPTLKERLAVLRNGRVASIVGVSFLAAVASLGLYTYLIPVLNAGRGGIDAAPYLLAWGIGGVAGSFSMGALLDKTGRPFVLVAGILATMAVAMLLLPLLAPVPVAVMVLLVLWGAAGWGLQVPQQHELLATRPEFGSIVVALNGSALYLGSAVGSALGGLCLSLGVSASALPMLAGCVAGCGLLVHCTAVRMRSR